MPELNAEWLLAFVVFALSTAGTPGPNNAIMAASAANWGFARTLPGVFGISLGFAFMIAAVGLGLGEVFRLYPSLALGLKVGGTLFLLHMAWNIATARPDDSDGNFTKRGGDGLRQQRPPGFLRMAAFQWINPKGWAMVLSMLGVYAGQNADPQTDMLIMAALFAVIGTITAAFWAGVGLLAGRWLNARQMVMFNRVMAALLVGSLVLIWA